jgi:hypothetical protein
MVISIKVTNSFIDSILLIKISVILGKRESVGF